MTLAASANEVLRLKFRPARIGGGDLSVEAAGGGDFIVRVPHRNARRISVSG